MIFECGHRASKRADGSCSLCLPTTSVVVFLVGAPGVGKTTIARELINRHGPILETIARPKWTVCRDLALAGHYLGEPHDGGDTIPYTGARLALVYWEQHLARRVSLTVLDGARFATKPSLAWVRERARVVVAHVVLHETEAEVRRLIRSEEARVDVQDPTWVRGATTAARNFAAHAGAVEVRAEYGAREAADEISALVCDS